MIADVLLALGLAGSFIVGTVLGLKLGQANRQMDLIIDTALSESGKESAAEDYWHNAAALWDEDPYPYTNGHHYYPEPWSKY